MSIGILNSGFLFNNSSSSSATGSIYSLLSEYNNIRSGTYYKVVKAYYAKKSGESSKTTSSVADKVKADKASTAEKALAGVQADAKNVTAAADALVTKGSDSLFNQKDITTEAEDGTVTTTKGYDTDAIYTAVKKFTDSYNSLMDSASSGGSASVQNRATSMANNTKAYEKLLNNVGITIGSNNKLSIDEEAFKAADMNTVKTLFNGTGSYAYSISSSASMINFAANSALNTNATYTGNGTYNSLYSTGNLMNSIF